MLDVWTCRSIREPQGCIDCKVYEGWSSLCYHEVTSISKFVPRGKAGGVEVISVYPQTCLQ